MRNDIPLLVIPLLGSYPKKMKTLIQKDICIPMFICHSTIYNNKDMEATHVPHP